MVGRSIQTGTRSTDIICTWRNKPVGMVSSGRYLKIPGTSSWQPVYRTSIRELRCDRGSRYMVRIERTGGLAFGDLCFDFIHGPDARYTGHPRERHGVRD